MKNFERYSGTHIGVARELTPAETTRIVAAAANVAARPPWTAKKLRANANFRRVLIDLFEDGVGSRYIAEALGWKQSRVAMHIRQARLDGMASGVRRYIAPPDRPSNAAKRQLEPREIDDLARQFEAIPKTSGKGVPQWTSKEGRALIEHIKELQEDSVSLSSVGNVIGMSRQAISLHVARGAKANAPSETEPRSITAREAASIKKKYDLLKPSSSGAKIWSSPEGLDLINEITELIADGVPVATVHKKDRNGRPTRTVETAGIDSALKIPSSVIGRMISMKDRLAERMSVSA